MAEKWQLPPLILHPFGGGGTDELLEGSRASLALQGAAAGAPRVSQARPAAAGSREDETELQRRVLIGRYHEIRMLLFLGKDLFRWLQQCVESVERVARPGVRLVEQSFAAMVVEDPPANIREKLEKWGVSDRRAVFSRAIGINSLFNNPPEVDTFSPILLRNYHRFADHAYICFQHLRPFTPLEPEDVEFQIYASEEYARLLSEQWAQK
jgi:hypothetical protein